jgi:trk system potassium uptake protein TrkH
MSDWKPVLYVLGHMLIALAAAMAVPAIVDAAGDNPDWRNFAAAASVTLAVGGILIAANQSPDMRITVRQGFLLTTMAWLVISAFAALPFVISDVKLNYADAFFEAISGLTTTGATVLTGLDTRPPGLLLWRALLEWLGGIGIIAMAVVMLPFLNVGGMQLFRMESSDRSDKFLPRPRQVAVSLLTVYGLISLACLVVYWALGMSFFEAICHMMATISTGGYSTSDASIGHFQSPAIEWAATLFMLASGLPFVLYVGALKGEVALLTRNQQVRGFVAFAVAVSLAVALWLWRVTDTTLLDALRLSAFHVVSVVTTTGFVAADYAQWGGFMHLVALMLTFVGACAGSTAGGIKFYRVHILFDMMRARGRQLIFPNAVFPATYDGRPVSAEVRLSIALFVFVYIGTVGLLALLLAALGLDLVTALSGAATAVGNVGPGLGLIIGPAGTFTELSDAAKWLLSAGMLLGRLEMFTVLVLLSPSFWRR